ncbi:zinc finger Ran-binding domain-containing protein 2-like isoform X3 [Mytilus trossulus]
MSSRFKPNEGDWICNDTKCGNVNFSRRTQCNKCGKDKKEGLIFKKGGTEIGKGLAEKSKGLFSADDWQCKSCGNVNWARRMTCNLCNAPKYGKTEQRTGFGGGYMERDEVVEYVHRDVEEDDSLVDEFGRKKKKRNSIDTKVIEPEPKHEVKEEEVEEEDEEEDDDDDEDVSKYQLDSDEDDDDGGDASKYDLEGSSDEDGKKSKSSSRSSSRSSRSKSRSSSRSSSSSSSSSRSRSRSRSSSVSKRKRSGKSRSR